MNSVLLIECFFSLIISGPATTVLLCTENIVKCLQPVSLFRHFSGPIDSSTDPPYLNNNLCPCADESLNVNAAAPRQEDHQEDV